MTTLRVKCDYCGYYGYFEIDVFGDTYDKFICVDCGTDDLRRMIMAKINQEEVKNESSKD